MTDDPYQTKIMHGGQLKPGAPQQPNLPEAGTRVVLEGELQQFIDTSEIDGRELERIREGSQASVSEALAKPGADEGITSVIDVSVLDQAKLLQQEKSGPEVFETSTFRMEDVQDLGDLNLSGAGGFDPFKTTKSLLSGDRIVAAMTPSPASGPDSMGFNLPAGLELGEVLELVSELLPEADAAPEVVCFVDSSGPSRRARLRSSLARLLSMQLGSGGARPWSLGLERLVAYPGGLACCYEYVPSSGAPERSECHGMVADEEAARALVAFYCEKNHPGLSITSVESGENNT